MGEANRPAAALGFGPTIKTAKNRENRVWPDEKRAKKKIGKKEINRKNGERKREKTEKRNKKEKGKKKENGRYL